LKEEKKYIVDVLGIKPDKKDSICIFCGAGISYNSGLPLGGGLIDYILEQLPIDESNIKQIKDSQIPFEKFLETLEKNAPIDLIVDLFAEGLPNTNHNFIAKLVKYGVVKNVITTNFDLLIERALEIEKIEYKKLCTEKDFEDFNFKSSKLPILIKIHGTVEYKESIRTTLKTIASFKLTESRNKVLDFIFSGGYHSKVIFLGYSCSDVFDICSYISKIGEVKKEQLKEIYYINNSKSNIPKINPIYDIEKDRFDPKKEKLSIFKNYPGSEILINTDSFVKDLWSEQKIIDNNLKEYKNSYPLWENHVKEWSVFADKIPGLKHYITGSIFYEIQDFNKAIEYLNSAISKISNKDFNTLANCYSFLGTSYLMISNYYKSLEFNEKALEYGKKAGNYHVVCLALQNKGTILLNEGKIDDAENLFYESLLLALDIQHIDSIINGYIALGSYFFTIGKIKDSEKNFNRALEKSKEYGYKTAEVVCLSSLGSLYSHFGNFEKALECYNDSYISAKNLADKLLEAQCLKDIAYYHLFKGDVDLAENNFNESVNIIREIQNYKELSFLFCSLAEMYLHYNKLDTALDYVDEALKIAIDKTMSKDTEANCYLIIASINLRKGLITSSIEYCERVIYLMSLMKNMAGLLRAYVLLGEIYYYTKNYESSIEVTNFALNIALNIADRRGELGCYISLGNSYHYKKDIKISTKYIEKGLLKAKQLGDVPSESICLTNLANNLFQEKKYEQAIKIHENALDIAIKVKDVQGEAMCHENIGMAYNAKREYSNALMKYQQAEKIYDLAKQNYLLESIYKRIINLSGLTQDSHLYNTYIIKLENLQKQKGEAE